MLLALHCTMCHPQMSPKSSCSIIALTSILVFALSCLVLKKICTVPITLNLWIYVWSIKCNYLLLLGIIQPQPHTSDVHLFALFLAGSSTSTTGSSPLIYNDGICSTSSLLSLQFAFHQHQQHYFHQHHHCHFHLQQNHHCHFHLQQQDRCHHMASIVDVWLAKEVASIVDVWLDARVALVDDTYRHKPWFALGLGLPLTDLDVLDPSHRERTNVRYQDVFKIFYEKWLNIYMAQFLDLWLN